MKYWKHIAIGVAAVAWTIGATNAQDDNFEIMGTTSFVFAEFELFETLTDEKNSVR